MSAVALSSFQGTCSPLQRFEPTALCWANTDKRCALSAGERVFLQAGGATGLPRLTTTGFSRICNGCSLLPWPCLRCRCATEGRRWICVISFSESVHLKCFIM